MTANPYTDPRYQAARKSALKSGATKDGAQWTAFLVWEQLANGKTYKITKQHKAEFDAALAAAKNVRV